MRIFFSEHQAHYTHYTFNYAIYCEMQERSELAEIYAKGFLPYTGDLEISQDLFYLARSLRVDLDRFDDSSENRRISRKIEPLKPEAELIDIKDRNWEEDESFLEFCNQYAAERFQGGSMSKERFQYVLGKPMTSHICHIYNEQEKLGYVVCCIEGNTLHYWYSFFNIQYMRQYSLGKWIMWKVIRVAKEMGLKYVYLGTCYGEKSLYKIRDFKGIEYYNGSFWDNDVKKLKFLCKSDNEPREQDIFKDQEDKTAFLNQIID